jgi:protein-S-isoprenylcysteine O-methyltransferase
MGSFDAGFGSLTLSPWIPFGAFLGILCVFHLTEAALAWNINRDMFAASSFLCSPPYASAMALAILEFWLEYCWSWSRDNWKSPAQLACLICGFILIVSGDCLRKSAMLVAHRSFTHQIADASVIRERQHKLITGGPYKFVRHPGYLGFIIWNLGTQVLLCNPLCAAVHFGILTVFFRSRVRVEEAILLRSELAAEYEQYKQRTTCSGVPCG